MNIGVFLGSFNPIHIGHMIIANYFAENSDLDEIWLMVSPQNPWKDLCYLENIDHRINMACLATKDYIKLSVSDFEKNMPTPSYTFKTLRNLRQKYPTHCFKLITGMDTFSKMSLWENSNEIFSNHKILIYPRLNFTEENIDIKNNKIFNMAPIINISSTKIRQDIKQGKEVRPLIPEPVLEYIKSKKLYI